jgi:hypothetical protein
MRRKKAKTPRISDLLTLSHSSLSEDVDTDEDVSVDFFPPKSPCAICKNAGFYNMQHN